MRSAAAYDVAVQKIFRRLDIPWQWILDRLVGVVSDGAIVMRSYVARLNAARPSSVDPIVWIRDAAHGLMRSVAHRKATVRTWYKALDLAVSLMCIFYRTSSKRMRGLGRHGGKHCFQRRTGVRWVEAMGRELTIVLRNLDAALKHLPEYISAEGDAQRKAKATGLLAALSNNLFQVSAAFFADVFTIVCAGSKLVQANRGVTIDAVRGLVNLMCSQLAHLRTHVLEGGWESRLCVDPAISPVRGSRACFLNALIADLQSRFAQGNWVNPDSLPDFAQASSCSCERVFSYMTQADAGQPAHFMSDNLLVRCNGEAPEDWCPAAVFNALRDVPFRPRKRKVDGEEKPGLDDCPLLHFEAFKDLAVSVDSPTPEVTDEMRALWTVSQSNDSSPNCDEIWETYGVIGDAESDAGDVDQDVDAPSPALEPIVQQDVHPAPPPPPPQVQRPTSDGSARVQFQYDVDREVCKAMKQGTMI